MIQGGYARYKRRGDAWDSILVKIINSDGLYCTVTLLENSTFIGPYKDGWPRLVIGSIESADSEELTPVSSLMLLAEQAD